MGKNDELLNKYINGDDLSEETIEKLENNKYFMEKVIDITNDPKMYYYCSDRIKKDPGFIRFLMKKFISNLDFLCEVTDFYLKNSKNNSDYIEIVLLIRAILKSRNDDRYEKYNIMRNTFYSALRLVVEKAKEEKNDDYKYQYDMGLGFWYIFDTYSNNELVINFYAKKMLEEIFDDGYYALDRILHSKYSSLEELENKGVYSVLINVVSIYDNMLAAYVSIHKNLLKKAIDKYYKVLKRWDKYVDVEESKKYDIISTKVEEYMSDKFYDSILFERELYALIGKQLGIEDKLIQYQIIDNVDIDILKEEEQNYYATINSSLIDRINYNNVKSIIKSTLFPNQQLQEETIKKAKVLSLDDYRKSQKKEKLDKSRKI
jgi:hypothetical protein